MLYKYSFDDDTFESVDIWKKKKNTRQSAEGCDHEMIEVEQKYKHKLPISSAKKKDLLHLCESGAVSIHCKPIYEALPCKDMEDRLPEPDMYESESDEE